MRGRVAGGNTSRATRRVGRVSWSCTVCDMFVTVSGLPVPGGLRACRAAASWQHDAGAREPANQHGEHGLASQRLRTDRAACGPFTGCAAQLASPRGAKRRRVKVTTRLWSDVSTRSHGWPAQWSQGAGGNVGAARLMLGARGHLVAGQRVDRRLLLTSWRYRWATTDIVGVSNR